MEKILTDNNKEEEIFQLDDESDLDLDKDNEDEDIEPTDAELAELEKENADGNMDEISDIDIRNTNDGQDKDLFQIFMKKAIKFPLLTKEEEQKSARTGEAGKKKLVNHNLRLVVKIAIKKYQNQGLELMELIQEGILGLFCAAEKFDPERGRFATYATWWIRQKIIRALVEQSHTIRIPVYMMELLNKLDRTKEYLRQELGREADEEEVAEKMGIKAEKVKKLREIKALHKPASLSAPTDNHSHKDEGGRPLENFQAINKNQPQEEEEEIDQEKLWAMVSQALHCDGDGRIHKIVAERNRGRSLKEIMDEMEITELTKKEKYFYILARRNDNILEKEDNTLDKIGQEFGLTRERIRQMEAKAIRQLSHPKWRKEFKKFL